jgi:hypothetical protein
MISRYSSQLGWDFLCPFLRKRTPVFVPSRVQNYLHCYGVQHMRFRSGFNHLTRQQHVAFSLFADEFGPDRPSLAD